MSIIFSTFLFLFSFSFGMYTFRLKLNLLNWNANSLNWNKKIHLNRLEFDWHRTRWNAWNKQKSSDYPRIFKCSWKLRRNLYEKKKRMRIEENTMAFTFRTSFVIWILAETQSTTHCIAIEIHSIHHGNGMVEHNICGECVYSIAFFLPFSVSFNVCFVYICICKTIDRRTGSTTKCIAFDGDKRANNTHGWTNFKVQDIIICIFIYSIFVTVCSVP